MDVVVISDTIQEFNGERFYLCGSYFQHQGRRLHRIVWQYFHGNIPDGMDIHHKDSNKTHNDINNLELMDRSEHHKEHGKSEEFKQNGRIQIKKAIEAAKEWHHSEEGREWHSKHAKETNAKLPLRTYNCTFCGKEFQTKFHYPEGSNHFCHNNCKAAYRRRRVKLEGNKS